MIVSAVGNELVIAHLLVAVLVSVIGAESVAAARRRVRGEPSPLERIDASAATPVR